MARGLPNQGPLPVPGVVANNLPQPSNIHIKIPPKAKRLRVALVGEDANALPAARKMIDGQASAWSLNVYLGSEKALQGIQAEPPDVVLLAAFVSASSTDEFLRSVKRHAPALPVVIFTPKPKPGEVLLAVEAGASGYLTGPPSGLQLVRACEDAVQGFASLGREAATELVAALRHAGTTGPSAALTAREHEALIGVAGGLQNKEIAELMGLQTGTVHVYLTRIYHKLSAHSRQQAVQRAFGGHG